MSTSHKICGLFDRFFIMVVIKSETDSKVNSNGWINLYSKTREDQIVQKFFLKPWALGFETILPLHPGHNFL